MHADLKFLTKCMQIPRKSAIGVPDDLFKDALKDLFLSFFQFIDKAKELRDRIKRIGSGGRNDNPKTIHVIVSFITFGAYVVVFSISTVLRGTLAASIVSCPGTNNSPPSTSFILYF